MPCPHNYVKINSYLARCEFCEVIKTIPPRRDVVEGKIRVIKDLDPLEHGITIKEICRKYHCDRRDVYDSGVLRLKAGVYDAKDVKEYFEAREAFESRGTPVKELQRKYGLDSRKLGRLCDNGYITRVRCGRYDEDSIIRHLNNPSRLDTTRAVNVNRTAGMRIIHSAPHTDGDRH